MQTFKASVLAEAVVEGPPVAQPELPVVRPARLRL